MASPQNVVARQEIMVNGYRFRIKGKVRVANITVTENPVAYGATDNQGNTQVMSQLIQATANAGSGVFKGNPRTDTERFWTGDCEVRYKNMICLPPLTYDMGAPAAITTEDCILTIEYNNLQYFVFSGGLLYRWDDGAAVFDDSGTVTGGWSSLIQTLTGNPTDATIFRDYLYFAYGTAMQKMVISGTETFSAVSGSPAATLLYVWDEKLWRLYNTSGVWTTAFTSNGGSGSESWTTGGTLPTGITPQKLMTFRNVVGDEVLALLTDVGLWLYDATNAKWRQTEVRIPRLPVDQVSDGDIFRDGKLYFSSGNMGMASVQPGNPFVVTAMGLDRDDGVPEVESGKIAAVAADFNWMLALVDGSVVTEEDTMDSGLGAPFDTPEWSTFAGTLTLRAYAGGWSTIWKSDPTATPGMILYVSGAYSKRRVYWGASHRVYCQDLYSGVHNPRFNPASKFAPGPNEHITSWMDFGSDVRQKINGHFWMRTTGCTSTEKVTVYYQIDDLTSDTWTLLQEITTNAMHELKPGGAEGLQCRLIRFKFVLQRGTDAALTPRIEFWANDFMRVLPATYAYVVVIDLSRRYKDQTPGQMVKLLKDMADPEITPNFIPFTFQDEFEDEPQTHYGRISRLQGQSSAGADDRGEGWFQMSFMVPYLGDSV